MASWRASWRSTGSKAKGGKGSLVSHVEVDNFLEREISLIL